MLLHNHSRQIINKPSMKALLLLLLPMLSIQWWDVGHMLAAAIAESRLNQLSPVSSFKFREIVLSINNLVDNRTRTFIESACWPDDLKQRAYNMQLWNDWHFIDKPHLVDGVFAVINMTETVLSSVKVIESAVKVLSVNNSLLTAEKAMFARYLIHVVGDIHQPLHSVSLYNSTYPSGDRGGNSLKIVLLNGTTQNLHAFWDAGAFKVQNDSWFISRPMGLQNMTALKEVAANYIKTYGPQVEKLAQDLNPDNWARESYDYAKNTTYPLMFTSNKITEQYSNTAYEASKKRITLAGYRIANLVISIYEKTATEEERAKAQQLIAQELRAEQERAHRQARKQILVE